MKPYRYILLITLLVFVHQNAFAGMYRCVDKNNKVRYTDNLESAACSPMVFNPMKTSVKRGKTSWNSGSMSQRASRYEDIIRYSGVRYNIDPHLIRAVIRTESGFDPRAVSKKGAQGLMQLMPGTAKELRVRNPFDPKQNIDGGTRYLRSLLNTFKQDIRLALAAYNAGPTIVKKERNVPKIPETVQYVKRVLRFYKQYKNGAA